MDKFASHEEHVPSSTDGLYLNHIWDATLANIDELQYQMANWHRLSHDLEPN